jgi:polysaccharide biosynthesis/export protein
MKLIVIPNVFQKLTFGLNRKLFQDRKWVNIKSIWTHLRSLNPNGLAQTICQFLKNTWYKFTLLFILCLLCSCLRPCHDYAIMGVDEFVIDSYKIREGKLSILEMEGIEVGELPDDALDEYTDVIAEGDLLNIVLYHPTRKDLVENMQLFNECIGGIPVTQCRIDLPDMTPIEVAGLTLEQARQKVKEQYREQIQDVDVFISYRDRLRKKVELTGLVAIPTIPVDGKIRLYEVLAKAHIAPQANLFKSYVMRDCDTLPIDFHRLINEGDMCQNVVMKGGDKIFIAAPTDATVMLMGEVGQPRAVSLPYGFMSLREALVTAGGIPFTGDRSHIQVIRGNLQCPKIYVVSWEHIVHLPNDSLLLMPGDTIYVSAKPITEWNRFIDQLLPSVGGIQAGYGLYQITR